MPSSSLATRAATSGRRAPSLTLLSLSPLSARGSIARSASPMRSIVWCFPIGSPMIGEREGDGFTALTFARPDAGIDAGRNSLKRAAGCSYCVGLGSIPQSGSSRKP
jgi:hypothetical protein